MNREQDVTERLIGWLRGRGDCRLDPGLSEGELSHAERVLGMSAPPLWRAVLSRAHPVSLPGSGGRYPDWRNPSGEITRTLVGAPVAGLLFDVAENDFWWRAWGPAPAERSRRLAVAGERLAEVPRLTPLAGHLYVAGTDDSPVFSILQGDLYIPALSLVELAGSAGPAAGGKAAAGGEAAAGGKAAAGGEAAAGGKAAAGRGAATADGAGSSGEAGQAAVRAADYPIGEVPFWSELHAYSQLGHEVDGRFAGLARGGS